MTTSPAAPAPARRCPCLSCHLEAELAATGCDCTLRHTDAWITQTPGDWRWLPDWLRNGGGYCDCEVVMNVLGDGPRPGSPAYDPRLACPDAWEDDDDWADCDPDCPCRQS